MTFQVTEYHGPPVNGMKGLEHLCIPPGNCRICIADNVKEMCHHGRPDTGHITGGNKNEVALCRKRPRMKASDGTDTRADIRNAPYAGNMAETFTLIHVPRHENDLVNHPPQGVNQALDEGLSVVREEIFLLPVCPPCFTPDKDDCRSQDISPFAARDSRNLIRSTIQVLQGVGIA